MKKISTLFAICCFAFGFSQQKESQTTELRKSMFGVQVGFFGVNVYNEAALSKNVALRSEIDLIPTIWGGIVFKKTGFALFPTLSVSPKWYYNLKERNENNQNSTNNTANYLSAKIGFIPKGMVISNYDNISAEPRIYLIPSWGVRRNFAKNFNYEFQAGLGLGKNIEDSSPINTAVNISFRIGYDF